MRQEGWDVKINNASAGTSEKRCHLVARMNDQAPRSTTGTPAALKKPVMWVNLEEAKGGKSLGGRGARLCSFAIA